MGNWIFSKWVIMEYMEIIVGQNNPVFPSTTQHPKLTQTFWEVMCQPEPEYQEFATRNFLGLWKKSIRNIL